MPCAARSPSTAPTSASTSGGSPRGQYESVAAGLKDWVAPHLGALEPVDQALAARYDRLFPAYRDGYLQMAPVWQALHGANRGE
jgi:erythritol kinase